MNRPIDYPETIDSAETIEAKKENIFLIATGKITQIYKETVERFLWNKEKLENLWNTAGKNPIFQQMKDIKAESEEWKH